MTPIIYPRAPATPDIAAELIRFAEAADCDPEDIERVRAKVRRVQEGETGRESR